jgi:hypothetical protein
LKNKKAARRRRKKMEKNNIPQRRNKLKAMYRFITRKLARPRKVQK